MEWQVMACRTSLHAKVPLPEVHGLELRGGFLVFASQTVAVLFEIRHVALVPLDDLAVALHILVADHTLAACPVDRNDGVLAMDRSGRIRPAVMRDDRIICLLYTSPSPRD